MIRIVSDSREQCPYTFSGLPVEIITGTLQSADYSLFGFESEVAVERKELSDLLGCLTHDRERFHRELERLRGYQSAALVIEAPLLVIRSGRYRSQMRPEAAEQSLISVMERYRMPVFFARDRRDGEQFTYNFLRHFHRHAIEKYKVLGLEGGNPE